MDKLTKIREKVSIYLYERNKIVSLQPKINY